MHEISVRWSLNAGTRNDEFYCTCCCNWMFSVNAQLVALNVMQSFVAGFAVIRHFMMRTTPNYSSRSCLVTISLILPIGESCLLQFVCVNSPYWWVMPVAVRLVCIVHTAFKHILLLHTALSTVLWCQLTFGCLPYSFWSWRHVVTIMAEGELWSHDCYDHTRDAQDQII